MSLKIYATDNLIVFDNGTIKDSYNPWEVKYYIQGASVRFKAEDPAGVVTYTEVTTDLENETTTIGTEAQVIAYLGSILGEKKSADVGTWGYNSGISGTLALTGSKRVLQITAIAEEAAASLTINGGDTITLPYGTTDKVSSEITIEPKGNLTDPTIIFTGTKAYFVEYVS